MRRPRPAVPVNIQNQFFKGTAFQNNINYTTYFNRLVNIAISLFKWNNLPESVDARMIEYTLLLNGRAIFFKDDVMNKFLCLPSNPQANFNIYGDPLKSTAFSYFNSYHNMDLDLENSVTIYDNMLHTTFKGEIAEYVCRLYEIDNVIRTNVRAQKTPLMVVADDKQRLSMLQMFQKYDGNEPVIFGYKNLDLMDNIKAIKLDVPLQTGELLSYKQAVFNEFLNIMGVASSSEQKKERLITSEVQTLTMGANAMRLSRLNMREQACEKINNMFELNISVEFNDLVSNDNELDNEGVLDLE